MLQHPELEKSSSASIRERVQAECSQRNISVSEWVERFVHLSALKLVDDSFTRAIQRSLMH